jgi:glycerol-3-phosphate O-acyltransferase
VPCTLTYPLVLEAETLIEDYLAEAGKSRYIIIDDESSRLTRVTQFLSALLRHESHIRIEILAALDPFGNRVQSDGTSLDAHDRPIAIECYLKRDGALVRDAQRDEEFTKELEERLVASYPRGTVVSATHVVSLLLFALLEEEHPEWDLYRLLKGDEAHPGFAIETVRVRLASILQRLAELSDRGDLQLDALVASGDVEDILSRALVHLTVYHATPIVERRGMRVFVLHRPLVYYYRNRLAAYDFADAVGGQSHGEW